MHLHPLRSEYIVVGYQGGQFLIIDLSLLDKHKMLKAKKIVKDHHKGSPIVSIKFCDWIRERLENTEESKGDNSNANLDAQAWMIASVDLEGKVVISCIRTILGILKASKFVILDPTKQQDNFTDQDRFEVIESHFHKVQFPQGESNDN